MKLKKIKTNIMYTTIEQSKELVELGIDKETSDLLYPFNPYNELGVFGIPSIKDDCPKNVVEDEQSIPCWTLEALLTFMQKANIWVCVQYLPTTFDEEGKAIHNVWDVECEYSYLSFNERNKNLFDAVYKSVRKILKNSYNDIIKPNKK